MQHNLYNIIDSLEIDNFVVYLFYLQIDWSYTNIYQLTLYIRSGMNY